MLRVMTFNIRCGQANDGLDHWNLRREMLAGVIRKADPDVLAVQECIPLQGQWLRSELPGMGFLGTERGGPAAGAEMCAVFWRRDRLAPVDTGTSWLSGTPELPGSIGWDAAFPRIVTWARFEQAGPGGRGPGPFTVANAHLDHRGVRARTRSCAWLRDWLPHRSAVLLGDFNAIPGEAEYGELTAPRGDGRRLVDAYRAVGGGEPGAGTFHEFAGGDDGPRIDWVMTTDDVNIRAVDVDRSHVAGRYPSDHYPVIADLEFDVT